MGGITKRGLGAAAVVIVAAACRGEDAPPSAVSEDEERAAATITAEDFRERIGILAHDSMRGRATPSPELEDAARWIAEEFRRMELVPAGDDGGFLQRYPLRARRGAGGAEGASVTAPNVVALLEGSDPDRRQEYVLFSGHMDHVGVGNPDANGDSIYNGADDDASGTVAVMEIAEAFAALPEAPPRSMIFLLVSGEERGLLGSRHFADNPPVPIDQIVAALNTDMVGRNWPDTIVAIGKEHSDLGETLERVNSAHPELGMTAIDDLWPEENFYSRSDHYNFARRGVPVLFFFNGTHEDYHRPGDEPDKIDNDKAARIARLVFHLGMEIAISEAPPQWDPDSRRRIVDDGQ